MERAAYGWLAGALIALCSGAQSGAAAEAPITGVGPDAALSVGAGIGIDRVLDANVFARLRLGGLIAFEPWVLNLGFTGELGGLAEHGLGLELELNHFSGPWLQVNVSRVAAAGEQWMGHVALGFVLFGVEWQHGFGSDSGNALMFVLRFPLGIWWLLHQHEQRDSKPRDGGSS